MVLHQLLMDHLQPCPTSPNHHGKCCHASPSPWPSGIPEAKEAKAVVVLDAMEGHPFRVALAFTSGDMKLHECLGSESAAVFVW